MYRRRILIGDDAHKLDQAVRESPEQAYEEGGMQQLFESQVNRHCCAAICDGCCDLSNFTQACFRWLAGSLLQNVEGWSKPGSLRIEAEAQAQTAQADAEVETAAEPAPEPARARI